MRCWARRHRVYSEHDSSGNPEKAEDGGGGEAEDESHHAAIMTPVTGFGSDSDGPRARQREVLEAVERGKQGKRLAWRAFFVSEAAGAARQLLRAHRLRHRLRPRPHLHRRGPILARFLNCRRQLRTQEWCPLRSPRCWYRCPRMVDGLGLGPETGQSARGRHSSEAMATSAQTRFDPSCSLVSSSSTTDDRVASITIAGAITRNHSIVCRTQCGRTARQLYS